MDLDETVLPQETLTDLLLALPPARPSEAGAARILRRARARIDAQRPIRAVRHDVGWSTLAPGLERKLLFDDGTSISWLLRLAAGADLPEHVHEDGAEECLVLDGEVWLDGERFGPGDYMLAVQGSRHPQTRTPTGATMFLRTPSPRRGNAACASPG